MKRHLICSSILFAGVLAGAAQAQQALTCNDVLGHTFTGTLTGTATFSNVILTFGSTPDIKFHNDSDGSDNEYGMPDGGCSVDSQGVVRLGYSENYGGVSALLIASTNTAGKLNATFSYNANNVDSGKGQGILTRSN